MKKITIFFGLLLAIFLAWNPAYAGSFQPFQFIPTNEARSWEAFSIDGTPYLALASLVFPGANTSEIYRFNGSSFSPFQPIGAGSGLYDVESFKIGADTFLAAAAHYAPSSYDTTSTIYKWNGSSFGTFQSISTKGATDWESFTIAGDTYLAVANRNNDITYDVKSKIYKWDGTQFSKIQSIDTHGASDWEHFTIGGDHYLALANIGNIYTHEYNVDSEIFKWNGTAFESVQQIATNGGIHWEHFTIDGQDYLVVANDYDGSSGNIDSVIYRWDGSSFVPFQNIPTNSAHDWEAFVMNGETYLALANGGSAFGDPAYSYLYKWDGSGFVEVDAIWTLGAVDWEHFTIGGTDFLAVANYRDGGSYEIDSVIYDRPVPLPSAMLLLGSGLIGLAGLRSKFRTGE